jgi:hemin uptake protein HemP
MNSHNPEGFFHRVRRAEQQPREEQIFDRREPRIVSSQSLFQGEREIGIDHSGSHYRLKITRQGKLILNK